jgi:competence protein ComFA
MKTLICKRCGNQDIKLFSYNLGKPYCRRCIEFNKPIMPIKKYIVKKKTKPILSYNLSFKQIELSNKIINAKGDVYISAVTGSGKTEITLAAIALAINQGYRVGFVIPRKAIVIEIATRLRKIFPDLNISEIYQGTKYDYDGDIIVLTAHQAFRYTNRFGLLIVDEYDAFPLDGNKVLQDIVRLTGYDKKVFLSATFRPDDLINKNVGYLNKRYHNYPLPVPLFRKVNLFKIIFSLTSLIKINIELDKKLIIYFPTIKLLNFVRRYCQFSFANIIVIHSRINNVGEIIKDLNKLDKFIVFSTIILERGVTIANVNVAVFRADHKLFSSSNLIQIAGRVGRLKNYPTGEVIFFGRKITNEISEAIKQIKRFNA